MTIRTGVTAKVSGAGVASLAVPLTGLSPGSNGLLVLVGWNGVGNGVKSVADNMSGTYAEAWFGPGGAGGTSFVDAFVLSPSSVARESRMAPTPAAALTVTVTLNASSTDWSVVVVELVGSYGSGQSMFLSYQPNATGSGSGSSSSQTLFSPRPSPDGILVMAVAAGAGATGGNPGTVLEVATSASTTFLSVISNPTPANPPTATASVGFTLSGSSTFGTGVLEIDVVPPVAPVSPTALQVVGTQRQQRFQSYSATVNVLAQIPAGLPAGAYAVAIVQWEIPVSGAYSPVVVSDPSGHMVWTKRGSSTDGVFTTEELWVAPCSALSNSVLLSMGLGTASSASLDVEFVIVNAPGAVVLGAAAGSDGATGVAGGTVSVPATGLTGVAPPYLVVGGIGMFSGAALGTVAMSPVPAGGTLDDTWPMNNNDGVIAYLQAPAASLPVVAGFTWSPDSSSDDWAMMAQAFGASPPVTPPSGGGGTYTQLIDQPCVAGSPASLVPIPTTPALETLPSGPNLENIPGTYYDRCDQVYKNAQGQTLPLAPVPH